MDSRGVREKKLPIGDLCPISIKIFVMRFLVILRRVREGYIMGNCVKGFVFFSIMIKISKRDWNPLELIYI